MKIYVCYFEYDDGWDSCSHPEVVFLDETKAETWKSQNGDTARVAEMEEGETYFVR